MTNEDVARLAVLIAALVLAVLLARMLGRGRREGESDETRHPWRMHPWHELPEPLRAHWPDGPGNGVMRIDLGSATWPSNFAVNGCTVEIELDGVSEEVHLYALPDDSRYWVGEGPVSGWHYWAEAPPERGVGDTIRYWLERSPGGMRESDLRFWVAPDGGDAEFDLVLGEMVASGEVRRVEGDNGVTYALVEG